MKKILLIFILFLFSCSNSKIESSKPISKAIYNKDNFNLVYYLPMFIDLPGNFGRTPLTEAIESNDTEEFIILVNLGADINKPDSMNDTPLMYAISLGRKSMVEILLKNKVNLNFYDLKGETPLMKAVSKLNPNLVELILNYDTKVDAIDKDGNSALMRVIMSSKTYNYNRSKITELLLKKKANLYLKNKKGETPLMIASLPDETGIIDVISRFM